MKAKISLAAEDQCGEEEAILVEVVGTLAVVVTGVVAVISVVAVIAVVVEEETVAAECTRDIMMMQIFISLNA